MLVTLGYLLPSYHQGEMFYSLHHLIALFIAFCCQQWNHGEIELWVLTPIDLIYKYFTIHLLLLIGQNANIFKCSITFSVKL